MGRVLIVSACYPYPTRTGFDVRLADLAEWLARDHDVTLLVTEPTDAPSRPVLPHPTFQHVEYVRSGSEGAGLEALSRRAYRRLFQPRFTSWAYRPVRTRDRVHQLHATYRYDAVIAQTPMLAPVLRDLTGTLRIVDAVDLWFERYQSFEQAGEGQLLSHMRDPQEEFRAYRECADFTLASSLHDAHAMETSGQLDGRVLHTPVAFTPRPVPNDESAPRLLFAGASGLTNLDAARFLVAEVLPTVLRTVPEARLQLLRADDTVRSEFGAHPAVDCLPELPDIDDAYRGAMLSVIPLRLGSGIKIKVLESFSRGMPTIITPAAGQGIPLDEYAQERVNENAQDLSEEILRAIADADYRRRLGESGLAIIDRHYRPEVAYGPLLNLIERTCRPREVRSLTAHP
ncbi:MAG: glycosyltransferase [Planctomycetota bacterium]